MNERNLSHISARTLVGDSPDNVVPITSQARSAAEKFVAEHDRELLTILFTDLVDSTKLQSDLGNVEAARLTELHREIVRDDLAKYDAREIHWAGDSCLAVFTRPSDAVEFALRMQAEHRRVRETEAKLPTVRVGIQLGEIIVKKRNDEGKRIEDLLGLQVSEAARIMSLAQGNQIFCTRAVFDNARAALKGTKIDGMGDLVWVNYGPYILKGSEEPVEVCEIGSTDVALLKVPKPTDKCWPAVAGAGTTQSGYGHDFYGESSNSFVRGLFTGVGAFAFLAVILFLVFRSTWQVAETPADGSIAMGPEPIVKVFPVRLDSPDDPNVVPLARGGFDISPTGTSYVFVARRGRTRLLFVRPSSEIRARPLEGTQGAKFPFFSPDGQWIGFFTSPAGELRKISVLGGNPITLCNALNGQGAAWGKDGYVIFSSSLSSGLYRVKASGGEPEPVSTVDREGGETSHGWPHILPDGKHVVFTVSIKTNGEDRHIAVLSLSDSRHRILLDGSGTSPRYAPSGHLVFAANQSLHAVGFDPSQLQVTGAPTPVINGSVVMSGGLAVYAISSDGSLIYCGRTSGYHLRTLEWVSEDGLPEPLDIPALAINETICIDPAGARLALPVAGQTGLHIWIYDLLRPAVNYPLTSEGNNFLPVWTQNGNSIVFSSDRDGVFNLFRKRADGTGGVERISESEFLQAPTSQSRTNDILLFDQNERGTLSDLRFLTGENGIQDKVFLRTRFNEASAAFSSDGKWVAYVSNEHGPFQVYVQPFPSTGQKWRVSDGEGSEPLWSLRGSELYFRRGDKMLAVTVETEPTFSLSEPRLLFEKPYVHLTPRGYDVSADGRFLMIREETTERSDFVLVEGWISILSATP